MKILLTCPPMIGMVEEFRDLFEPIGGTIDVPDFVQVMSESDLQDLLPQYDGWIIGDDPATAQVFAAGAGGNLKAAIKWGVGVDNVDFDGAKAAGIRIDNTPGVFGKEVADLAMWYVTGLAREGVAVHQGVVEGGWPKPAGISLDGKTMGLIGFGDIGRNVGRRAAAADMDLVVYDPYAKTDEPGFPVEFAAWPERIEECDFLVITCALTEESRHMFGAAILDQLKPGVRVVNVSRGGLIDERALIKALDSGLVHSAALDVFEVEPLPQDSPLRGYKQCVFGSHNASNTSDAVRKVSTLAAQKLIEFLK